MVSGSDKSSQSMIFVRDSFISLQRCTVNLEIQTEKGVAKKTTTLNDNLFKICLNLEMYKGLGYVVIIKYRKLKQILVFKETLCNAYVAFH